VKIVEMRVTPIAVGDPPLLNAAGLHAPYALRTIVELVSDDRITGVGEIPGGSATLAMLRDAREVVVGHDPFQLNGLKQALIDRFGDGGVSALKDVRPWETARINHVWSAIEVACFDMMGKAVGRPVVDLLGGVVRERVPYSAYLFFKYEGAGGALGFGTDPKAYGWAAARQAAALDPEGIVAQARSMVDTYGFESIKLKNGILDPDLEVDSMLALRKAFGPQVPLRIDPNGAWTHATALRCGQRLQGTTKTRCAARTAWPRCAARWATCPSPPTCARPPTATSPAASPSTARTSSSPTTTSGAGCARRSNSTASPAPSAAGCRCTPTAMSASRWPR
jgi:glucarate dehydratase